MNDVLRTKCELLADNRDAVKKGFFWERDLMRIVAATVFTGAGKNADPARMKECRKILKKHQGIFSDFRSYAELLVISKMALAEDPESYIKDVIDIYKVLRSGKIFTSEHMALAALSIVDTGNLDKAEDVARKTREILSAMKKDHPFLTDSSDTSFVALLALTDRSVDDIVDEVDTGYKILKDKFPFHSNSVHSLAQIIALSKGSVESKCEKAIEIYDALKASKVKYGKEYELASLGALVNLNVDTATLVSDIAEASDYLKTRKGFGNITMGKSLRHMFAALLAAGVYAPEDTSMNASVISGTIASVIAQQIALMIALTVITASNAASSSST
ncbi:DUF4003 family protein [Butyrivibrio sp. FCS014]|uniref:DUF4003 family protein n=1 Tax=Butyrivibrio sp. FCS014 TaxID=1408304 RepID=UPI000463EA88|nr:DUF4003 family protein [Butyrivibrio sp. FCS014]